MFAHSRPFPFAVSLLTHGLILAWVVSGPVREKPESLYAQVIKPHASKLVWYNFREKLPDVSPALPRSARKPLRADVKLPSQEIVAGSAKAPRARQFVWQPAPKLEIQAELKSPNVLAIHTARPEPLPKRAQPKMFVPPAPPKPVTPALVPAAPDIQTAHNWKGAGNPVGAVPAKAPPRKFVAPRGGNPVDKAIPALPEAPTLAAAANPKASPVELAAAKAPPRDFVPPSQNAKPSPLGPPLPDAPALPEAASPSPVSMAIVGLNPAANVPASAPEGSRNARLSAGPTLRKEGGDGSAEGALLTVPGLLIHSGASDVKPTMMARAAPTSAGNLRAAMRTSLPERAKEGAHPAAMRVSSAPDPAWQGRDTYAMSVQMPNITSYAGSWMIWFTEREPSGDVKALLSPPVPLRKVDPKYYPAAIADRVEGRVRLIAVIRKDGRVDSVRLLEHLDDRLDHSAAEAMDKWQFEPALRGGQPVDVDAVIEIPFRLAPKVPK
jgi:TonB family protein